MCDPKTLVDSLSSRVMERLGTATTDILFTADDADIMRRAAARIEELEAEVKRQAHIELAVRMELAQIQTESTNHKDGS